MAPNVVPHQGYLGIILAGEIERRDSDEVRRRAAREGKTDINIYGTDQYGRVYQQVPRESHRDQVGRIWKTNRDLVFASNKLKDYNLDGKFTFDEFDGVKTTFSGREPILIFAKVNQARGNKTTAIAVRITGKKTSLQALWSGSLPSEQLINFGTSSLGHNLYQLDIRNDLGEKWIRSGVYEVHFYDQDEWMGGIRYGITE